MAALVISISSDTSDESMGSSIPRVILFCSILIEVHVVPADLLVAPDVGAIAVASPAKTILSRTLSFLKGMYHLHLMMLRFLDRGAELHHDHLHKASRSLIAGGERADLLDHVTGLKKSNTRLRDTLRMDGMRADKFRRRMGYMEDELRQICRFRYYDRLVVELVISGSISVNQNMTITRSGITPKAIKELIAQRVAKVLATYEVNRAAELVVKSQSQNGDDGDNGNGKGNGDGNGGGNGNGNGEDNRNGNPNRNDIGVMPVIRECNYHDFVKCQPLNVKGTEGVVGLIRWFEKMKTLFYISNCPEKYQVKYDTCTLLNSALTWWNSHKRTIGVDAAFAMSWRELMKLMTEIGTLSATHPNGDVNPK
nr:reverse transcriptase domain-containing protein [Tanacetum cinerariifolium]